MSETATAEAPLRQKQPQPVEELTPDQQLEAQFHNWCRDFAQTAKKALEADSVAAKAAERAKELRNKLEGLSYQLMQRIDGDARLIETSDGCVHVDRAEVKLVKLERSFSK